MAEEKDEAPDLLPGMPEGYYESPMAKYMNSSVHAPQPTDEGEPKEPEPETNKER